QPVWIKWIVDLSDRRSVQNKLRSPISKGCRLRQHEALGGDWCYLHATGGRKRRFNRDGQAVAGARGACRYRCGNIKSSGQRYSSINLGKLSCDTVGMVFSDL